MLVGEDPLTSDLSSEMDSVIVHGEEENWRRNNVWGRNWGLSLAIEMPMKNPARDGNKYGYTSLELRGEIRV